MRLKIQILNQTVSLLLVTTLLSSCEMKSQLKEMHDSTANMEGYTKKMSDTTERMDGKTTDLHTTMIEMKDLTDKNMKEMSGDTKAMKTQTVALGEKMDGMAKTTENLDNKMGGMGKSTDNLDKNMETMVGTAGKLDNKMGNLTEVISEMVDVAKQGGASAEHRNALETLMAAKTYPQKLMEGKKYFVSFEYQLYSGKGLDQSQEKLDELAYEAFLEIFKTAMIFETEGVHPLASPEGFFSSEKSNNQASFNALAATMSSSNRKQEALREMNIKDSEEKFEPKTFYHLMVEALKQKNSSGSKPAWMSEVLNNETTAINLLQARHNFICTLILTKITDFSTHPIKKTLFSWKVNPSQLNSDKIALVTKYAKAALETRNDLKTLGVTPVYSKMLLKIMSNARFEPSTDQNQAWSEFQKLYTQLLTP